MNWIDKLERRYGNLGIPNLINGLLIKAKIGRDSWRQASSCCSSTAISAVC